MVTLSDVKNFVVGVLNGWSIPYSKVTGVPTINGNEVSGSHTGATLGLVDAVDGKGLSTNDYTTSDQTKLAGIEAGAQVNAIETISLNGTVLPVTDKSVAMEVMTSTVNNLTNYYNKTETYTKEEVATLINQAVTGGFVTVETLPTENISTKNIYLLAAENGAEGNLYDEYIYVNNLWERIGSTQVSVDLSAYQTKNLSTPITVDGTQQTTVEGALNAINGKSMSVDGALSGTSENPVQNKVVKDALDLKANSSAIGDLSDLTTSEKSNIVAAINEAAGTGGNIEVDETLSSTSVNPVQNKVIKSALDTMQTKTLITSISIAGQAVNNVEDALRALNNKPSGGGSVTVDDELSETSTNPVQNKVVKEALDAKQDSLTIDSTPTENSTNPIESGGVYTALSGKLNVSLKGEANGVAELDANGRVPSTQLPSYVDDVLEYATLNTFPNPGESGKIYVALDTDLAYRWSGSDYVEISKSLALGETSSTAYRGDRGKTAYEHSQITDGSNPHNTTFENIESVPQVATLDDITVDTPAFRSYGEVIDLSGKEYVVGRVIAADGSVKNLYQKTVVTTSPTLADGEQFIDLGVIIDNVISIQGVVTSTGNQNKPLAYYEDFGDDITTGIGIGVNNNYSVSNQNCFRIKKFNSDSWSGGAVKVTIRYTKVSD